MHHVPYRRWDLKRVKRVALVHRSAQNKRPNLLAAQPIVEITVINAKNYMGHPTRPL
jgi:hypothetical protein